jgi:hypothetical protein
MFKWAMHEWPNSKHDIFNLGHKQGMCKVHNKLQNLLKGKLLNL